MITFRSSQENKRCKHERYAFVSLNKRMTCCKAMQNKSSSLERFRDFITDT